MSLVDDYTQSYKADFTPGMQLMICTSSSPEQQESLANAKVNA